MYRSIIVIAFKCVLFLTQDLICVLLDFFLTFTLIRTRSSCLQTPTAEMCSTVKASGGFFPEVYIGTKFYYEFKQADSKFVVFKNIKTVDVL